MPAGYISLKMTPRKALLPDGTPGGAPAGQRGFHALSVLGVNMACAIAHHNPVMLPPSACARALRQDQTISE